MSQIRRPSQRQSSPIREQQQVQKEQAKREDQTKVEQKKAEASNEPEAPQSTVRPADRQASRSKANAAELALQQQLQSQLVNPAMDKPVYRDEGAGAAIDKLRGRQEKIGGDQMGTAIKEATADADGQAAGKEFHDLNDFVTTNWGRMNSDAKAKWAVYKGEVEKQQALGRQGIPGSDYDAMIARLDAAQAPKAEAAVASDDENVSTPKASSEDGSVAATAPEDGFGVGPKGSLRKEAAAKVAAETNNPKAKDQLDALNGLSDRLAAQGDGTIDGYLGKKMQAVDAAAAKAIQNPSDPVLRAELDVATADLEAASAKVSLLDTGYRQLTDDGRVDAGEVIETAMLTDALVALDKKVTDAQTSLEQVKATATEKQDEVSSSSDGQVSSPAAAAAGKIKTGIAQLTGSEAAGETSEKEKAPDQVVVARMAGQLATALAEGDDKAFFKAVAGQDKATLEAVESEFKNATGQDLRDRVENEFGNANERRALAALDGHHATADALELKRAMDGLGTDEKAITDTLKGKSPEELAAIREQYAKETKSTLDEDLRKDLSSEKLAETFRLMGEDNKARAVELRKAVDGLGTDEAGVLNVFNEAPADAVSDIEQAYKALYSENLERRLKRELSSEDLAKTFRSMNKQSAAQAVELFEAMDGWGTDENRILDTLKADGVDGQAVSDAYRRLFGRSLEGHLRNELSGRDLHEALSALGVNA